MTPVTLEFSESTVGRDDVVWTFAVVELARWYRRHRLCARAARQLVREAEAYLGRQLPTA
jgi:hypothetical protein